MACWGTVAMSRMNPSVRVPKDCAARDPAAGRTAASLRGFGPIGILAILAILLVGNYPVAPMSAILVLVWARWSETPWRNLGFARPTSWLRTIVAGIVFGVAFKILMKTIVMPLLGADPINQAYHFLAGNRAALPGMLYAVIVGAGFGEETVFRGYLFERLDTLLGSSVSARAVIVLFTSVLFGAGHYAGQGLAGAEQAAIVGLVFGTVFTVTRRLPLLMIAHAAFDVTAVVMIYGNLEATVAHLVFK
jgi:hypothetical protein